MALSLIPIMISLMVFDYTNKRTFTDIMESRFGKSRVEKVVFSADTSGTKKMLKDDGLSILKQGYEFPNPGIIRDPKKSQMTRQLGRPERSEIYQYTEHSKSIFVSMS